ncbi:tetratricopeptide repeat protein [Limimaricola pyoseonensis]|uniref:Uncharacterized conserved protein HemY, contains two TPR repeats n=1 Tax=Limimaricola pyoseonensis TaxID=521013 RepID=A0A1G7IX00_9RHOB|nr:tetratricopeptide repeat protein [Limimaricola pyoseonensis]SDF17183.1 Uncharacterized conserved protein HemY, contains two TPR repeats [Limimaricola pyoseonensis]
MPRHLARMLILSSVLLIAGCESAEERAARYFASAQALLEAGDTERALVELRNVFKHDTRHREARQLYADTVLARGEVAEAYGQFLRLVEQYPEALPARLSLAELAIRRRDWEEAERHGMAAQRLAPDDARGAAIGAALAYRAAVIEEDEAGRDAAAAQARAALERRPESGVALRVIVLHLLAGPAPEAALPAIDRALALEPEDYELQMLKFQILNDSAAPEVAQAQLERMLEIFPEERPLQAALIGWHMRHGDLAGAEALLRRLAGPADAAPEGHLRLVEFLRETKGPEAALEELRRLARETAGRAPAETYAAFAAGLRFDLGERAAAMAELQGLLEAAEPSDGTRRIRVMLARMLAETGNAVGARAEVETVLAQDPSHVEALKIRAADSIAADRAGEAINDLRAALDQAPQDVEAMLLMAGAHEREGHIELAGERLAAAAALPQAGAEEALRYAGYLAAQGRAEAARGVLEEAHRRDPGALTVLRALSELALAARDWTETDRILALLGAREDAAAGELALSIRTARLMTEERVAETVALLEAQSNGGASGDRAAAMLIEARFRAGDTEGARAALEAARQGQPDHVGLRLLSAQLHLAQGAAEAGEADLRAVLAAEPGHEVAVDKLRALMLATGRDEAAEAVLEAGLAARPEARGLLLMRAAAHERAGEIAPAVEIYETLYARDSGDLVVANNLASLIGTHLEDPAQLARAEVIARRLRGRELPAFQDTYGWIAHRQGDHETALRHLEPAAAGLPRDPMVQFHLGMTLQALGRAEAARERLEAALALWGETGPAQAETARAALAAGAGGGG